ncbi:hypothetical protein [Clostridium celatum]|uniref:hypothetical protein n=1 Tax=Clostridium celatum TaxID=36834 RepID=UPI00319E5906
MKLKNLLLTLTKEDILNLLKLQDKVFINELSLVNNIKIRGVYKVIGLNIDFYTMLTVNNFKNNILQIDINDFKLSNKGAMNPIIKRSVALFEKSINDIDGVTLANKILSIDIEKVVEVYCTEKYGIVLNKLIIDNLTSKNNCIELNINEVSLAFK